MHTITRTHTHAHTHPRTYRHTRTHTLQLNPVYSLQSANKEPVALSPAIDAILFTANANSTDDSDAAFLAGIGPPGGDRSRADKDRLVGTI